MASTGAVWGIDIGQCALKAMRCSLAEDGETLVADAFDFIEYPKILTEPDADPEKLVKDALKQFLADNSVRNTKVAISVPGQSGLARFIKLPPVEAKKIPDIVKYEAKQQIPFSLDDVIWDYQKLGGGMQDEGVALETEVGLFAMKRDQVFRALRPFRDAGIELDIVQLTPIAIYNAVVDGVMSDLLNDGDYDPEDPPDSTAVISMGTDTTDLVVTNGFRIWQRSIPIGGSHFTKQLMKEMKLTFAKAEQLKRNARQSEDPKAVFQAMRPVFNDFVQELQRSLGFFRSIDRRAKISQCVALGNAMLLPGLQPYIEKNLELPVKRVQEYRHLDGSSVISTPKYKDNFLSFGVTYGLCIQGVGRGRLSTNLIPRELITARLIRRKKPWALLALTVFMLGLGFNYLFNWNRWRAAYPDRFSVVESKVKSVSSLSSSYISDDEDLISNYARLKQLGNEVVGGADARFLVLELFRAINEALPHPAGEDPHDVSKVPYDQRSELFIESIDSQYFADLTEYFTTDTEQHYTDGFLKDLAEGKKLAAGDDAPPTDEEETALGEDGDEVGDDDDEGLAEDAEAGQEEVAIEAPTLPPFTRGGWVIQVRGFHFHNSGFYDIQKQYVVNTFMNVLEHGTVMLPAGPGEPAVEFTMKELGIYCPVVAGEKPEVPIQVPDLDPKAKVKQPAPGMESQRGNKPTVPMVNRTAYEFTLQFIWLETPASERMESRKTQASADQETTDDDVVGDF